MDESNETRGRMTQILLDYRQMNNKDKAIRGIYPLIIGSRVLRMLMNTAVLEEKTRFNINHPTTVCSIYPCVCNICYLKLTHSLTLCINSEF